MKPNIYSKENIKEVLIKTKTRFNNLYNKNYTFNDMVMAFNSLSSKHQDLLLKIDKNENDKAMLRVTYDNMHKFLVNNKNTDRAKINIKSLYLKEKSNIEEKFTEEKVNIINHISEILDNIDMPEDDKFVILYKYENNEEKPNIYIAHSMNLEERVVSEIVSRFWSIVREDFYKKEKKLINKKN